MLHGELPAGGEVNYFRGSDASKWQTGLSRFTQVVYRELWPGIDLLMRVSRGP